MDGIQVASDAMSLIHEINIIGIRNKGKPPDQTTKITSTDFVNYRLLHVTSRVVLGHNDGSSWFPFGPVLHVRRSIYMWRKQGERSEYKCAVNIEDGSLNTFILEKKTSDTE